MLSVLERFHCVSVVEGIHNGSIMSGGFVSISAAVCQSLWHPAHGPEQQWTTWVRVVIKTPFQIAGWLQNCDLVFCPSPHSCRIPTSSAQETGAPATPCMEIIVPVYLLFVVCKQYSCCLLFVCKQYTCYLFTHLSPLDRVWPTIHFSTGLSSKSTLPFFLYSSPPSTLLLFSHYDFPCRVLDKLTNLTVLNLSNTGVSWNLVSKVRSDICIAYWETLKSPLSMQRDFTNTPHIDKLVNLTGKI